MKPYFNNSERHAKLLYHAGLWMGTPWSMNASARGERGGVSCHNLPRAILMECGALPKDFPVIAGRPKDDFHRGGHHSQIEEFLAARPEFIEAQDELMPGDLIGLRIYRTTDHLALVVNDCELIHVLAHTHTCLAPFRIPPWAQRITKVWRPIES